MGDVTKVQLSEVTQNEWLLVSFVGRAAGENMSDVTEVKPVMIGGFGGGFGDVTQ